MPPLSHLPSLYRFRRALSRSFTLLTLSTYGCFSIVSTAHAGTIVNFRQGAANEFAITDYTGLSNTFINTMVGKASLNYGGLIGLSIGGGFSSLIRFDLSSIPQNTYSFESATLTLSPQVKAGAPITSFSVYAVNGANAAWQQGNKAGTMATTGEVSGQYLSKGVDGQTNVSWQSGGIFGAADYGDAPIFAGSFDPTSSTKVVITIPSEVIMNWINNPSTSAGIVIVSDAGIAQSFYSSNYSTAQFTPLLTLEYNAIPEPGIATLTSAALLLVFSSVGLRRQSWF